MKVFNYYCSVGCLILKLVTSLRCWYIDEVFSNDSILFFFCRGFPCKKQSSGVNWLRINASWGATRYCKRIRQNAFILKMCQLVSYTMVNPLIIILMCGDHYKQRPRQRYTDVRSTTTNQGLQETCSYHCYITATCQWPCCTCDNHCYTLCLAHLPSSSVCKVYSYVKGPWEMVTAATAKW